MKKIISALLITITLFSSVSYAVTDELVKYLDHNHKEVKPVNAVIEDDLIKHINVSPKSELKASIKKDKTEDVCFLIKPMHYVTTKNKELAEGDFIPFELVFDKTYNGKIYPRGTKVIGRIETITMNGAYGMPAEIIIDNFIIDSDLKAQGSIKKIGANRSLWVCPIGGVSVVFLGLGALLLFIRGGHAKLYHHNEFKIYAI